MTQSVSASSAKEKELKRIYREVFFQIKGLECRNETETKKDSEKRGFELELACGSEESLSEE